MKGFEGHNWRTLRKLPDARRSEWGRKMLRAKGELHLHRILSPRGHYLYMRLCQQLKKKLGRPLTPEDRAYVMSRYAEEIECSGRPFPR